LYSHPVHPYTRALLSSIPVPDPEKKKEHDILTGEVPSPINPPTGCHFHARCPNAEDKCRKDRPELKSVKDNPNWLVSCHLMENFIN
ncbi:MAG: peptide ABC transporter ATP-binding protein, partial [Gammaproteobacteria bacterium]|nr:peptide ABC transporter ATP-binding protein [Gammaproteobacteria bacterium]